MSFWKAVSGGLKKVASGVGKVEQFAAPIAGFIPGVGPLAAAGLSLNGKMMSAIGGNTHTGKPGQPTATAPVTDPYANGQDALNRYTTGAISSATPALQLALQGSRESAERRGVSNGEIATGDEDYIRNQFTQNIANAVAGQSMNVYNTTEQEKSAALDRAQAAANVRAQGKSSLWGSILGTGATALGAYLSHRGNQPSTNTMSTASSPGATPSYSPTPIAPPRSTRLNWNYRPTTAGGY